MKSGFKQIQGHRAKGDESGYGERGNSHVIVRGLWISNLAGHKEAKEDDEGPRDYSSHGLTEKKESCRFVGSHAHESESGVHQEGVPEAHESC